MADNTFDCLDVLEDEDISTLFYEKPIEIAKPLPEVYNGFKIFKPSTHSLWSHVLWNASKSLSNYLVRLNIHDSVIIELGSGTGLPLLSCYGKGNITVATDYPDKDVLNTLVANANQNLPPDHSYAVRGLLWGDVNASKSIISEFGKANVVLMSDLIFNHSQHVALLTTAKALLAPNGYILKTFSHHLPQYKQRDLSFFDKAKELGFQYEEIFTEKWQEMFPDDGGDLETRQTVYGFKLWLK